ncbi:uncharacterized protein [Anabrus simplex]|uniref:uncharacterized protein n=1 Tax=Anabrus simplex TaxID=316456 RepID=UPI0034DCD8AF
MERKYQKAITLSTVAIVVSCFVLVLFVGYLLSNHFIRKGFLQRFKKKKQMPDKFDVEASKNGYKADGLKLDMPSAQAQVPVLPRSASPSHCPVTPATTSTPLSRPRHPSEDATLEYAYDNPALAPSPVLDKDVPQEVPARKESSF